MVALPRTLSLLVSLVLIGSAASETQAQPEKPPSAAPSAVPPKPAAPPARAKEPRERPASGTKLDTEAIKTRRDLLREQLKERRELAAERRSKRRDVRFERREEFFNALKDRRQTLAEVTKTMQETRIDRRRARRRSLMAQWGAATRQPEVRAELRAHAWRMARLERARLVAQDQGKTALVERAARLIKDETARHEAQMKKLTASDASAAHPDPAKTGDAPAASDGGAR